jgi:cystathionine beta-lyase/cystathionine gamma-synthase
MFDENFGASRPLVPPIIPSSVYAIPDLDALDRICDGDEPGFIYARDNHPNGKALGEALAAAEAAQWGLVTASGMGALVAAVLAHVRQGDRIIASDRLYGRTTQFLTQELQRFGVGTDLIDVCSLATVERALQTKASALIVETISNPTLRVVDLPGLAKLAKATHVALIVDNTFATPTLCRPIEFGADVVIESLTKLIGGHSDVTLGVACGRQADLLPQLTQVMSIWGLASNPFDCWLAIRGLVTLPLRLKAASANALALANWLAGQSGVKQVVYPGRPDHPDHELTKQLLGGAFGNMLCFDLAGGREAVNRFMRQAPGIPFSPSLGHTLTTCSYPAGTSHRYVSPAERKRQGIGDGLIRLSVGVEDVEAVKAEIGKGLR